MSHTVLLYNHISKIAFVPLRYPVISSFFLHIATFDQLLMECFTSQMKLSAMQPKSSPLKMTYIYPSFHKSHPMHKFLVVVFGTTLHFAKLAGLNGSRSSVRWTGLQEGVVFHTNIIVILFIFLSAQHCQKVK